MPASAKAPARPGYSAGCDRQIARDADSTERVLRSERVLQNSQTSLFLPGLMSDRFFRDQRKREFHRLARGFDKPEFDLPPPIEIFALVQNRFQPVRPPAASPDDNRRAP